VAAGPFRGGDDRWTAAVSSNRKDPRVTAQLEVGSTVRDRQNARPVGLGCMRESCQVRTSRPLRSVIVRFPACRRQCCRE
jgi:hypothetical protein